MLQRVMLSAKQALTITARRNIGVSAVLSQKATVTDPIQKLFLDKIRDYGQKSKTAEGGLVDAGPETTKTLTDQMARLASAFGADKEDFTKFPAFNFSDPDLQPVGVQVDAKAAEEAEASVEEAEAESTEERAYWEI